MLAPQRGFTLIEMMITVVILGIVLAIAAPNMMSFVSSTRVKSITENLAQDLILARSEAIRRNKPVYLNVQNTCYGLSAKGSHCNCTVTDISNSNYCEVKQVTATPVNLAPASGQFDQLIFDSVRGLPMSNSFGMLNSTQNISITNSSYTAQVKMTIIGGVCISSSAGANKVAGYPNAC
ncbi:GspH/FimT family pseudopilin [Chitinibacter sp. SCUT-21]|uniref:GspH/FimT family pseudopilin n=1 Tax=Chitinibacter sp. SCUT-21 TaxID=2970891 RepID=UPI0035A682F3